MANAIQTKSRDFAIRIIGCYKFLTEQKGEYVISKQLLRCGTSIGANTRESKYESINSDCAELIKLLTSIIKKLKETDDKK